MIILSTIRAARDKGDEVRVLPNDPALAPIGTIFVDPFLEIESFQVWKHKPSIRDHYYRIAPGRESR